MFEKPKLHRLVNKKHPVTGYICREWLKKHGKTLIIKNLCIRANSDIRR